MKERRRAGERPRLVRVDADVQRWSALMAAEVSTWPQVSSRPMFGMLALYRGKRIFAALPRTRAAHTPCSLLVKLPAVRRARVREAGNPGAGWVAFEMASEADIGKALDWLGRAYRRAKARTRSKRA